MMLRTIATALACLAGAAALAQEAPSPDPPLPYLQTSPEDGFIARALRDERVGHRQFAAAFDDGASGCAVSAKPSHPFEIVLFKHGVSFDFNDFGVSRSSIATPAPREPGWVTMSFGPPTGGGSVATLVAPDGNGYVGLASAADCAVEIDWRKSARRGETWIDIPPVEAGHIEDWDEREKRLHWPWPDTAAGMMSFLFDTATDDGCPEGIGWVTMRAHSLLSELDGRHFDARIERSVGSRFSNDFTMQSGNCRYALSIRLYSRDRSGVLRPVAVSPAITAFHNSPEP